jgi:hypothetical protein
LAAAFLLRYEIPGNRYSAVSGRQSNAKFWYDYLLPFAPGAGPTTVLTNLKISNLSDTSATVSCIVKGGTKITYKLVDSKNNNINEMTLSIEQNKEEDIELLFYDYTKLVPNTSYKVLVSLSDGSTTFDDEITFTSLQSFPKNVSKVALISNDNKLPTEQFLLTTVPVSKADFGYWAKNGCGYTVQLIINGTVKSEKSVNSIEASQNIAIAGYFGYTPKLGDVVQIGIRTWVKYNGEKLFDNNYAKTSNSVCMLKNTIMPYVAVK